MTNPSHSNSISDKMLETLRHEFLLPRMNYLAATVVLQAKNGNQCGAATGFVIKVNSPNTAHEFFLVTARHVVADAANFRFELEALVIVDYDAGKPIQKRCHITLNSSTWENNNKSDISIMPFPIDQLPDNHCLSAIPYSELMFRKACTKIPTGEILAAYGRWSVQLGAEIVIQRNVTLATTERPTSSLYINGANQNVEIYLAEGMTSRCMSGGPVTHDVSGWGSSCVIGLIHGYWPLDKQDLAIDQTDAKKVVKYIKDVTSGIFMVIPINDIEPLLSKFVNVQSTPENEPIKRDSGLDPMTSTPKTGHREPPYLGPN